MTRHAARALAAAAVGATLALSAAVAGAQTLRVRVVDRATGEPVAGAIVSLLAPDSARLAPGLTDAAGHHELRAPAAGTYRVQVERVGFGIVLTLPIELARGASREQTILLTSRPTMLGGVRVVDRRTCTPDPARGAATADLWAEARKALLASQLTAARRLVPMEVRSFRRTLDDGLRVEEEAPVRARTGASDRPFHTLPPADLARAGYVREDGGGSIFYAPDAGVLLAEEFLRDHCFTAVGRSDADSGLVGLGFRPTRSRRGVVDVSGTLWLDAATAELRHLVYRYTNLSGVADAPHVGGRVEFARLPTGAWIVRRWHVRTPRLAAESAARGARRLLLLGYQEEGGEAVPLGGVADAPARAAPAALASLAGVVFDSTRGAGVPGAIVLVTGPRGAVLRDTTDAAGRFARSVDPGRYTVRVDHPLFAHPAARGELAADLAPGGAADLVAFVPGVRALAEASSCDAPSSDTGAPTGMLVGRARDAGTGAPLAFATVALRWALAEPLRAGPRVRVSAGGQERRVAADAAGRWVACGVPAGVPIHVGAAATAGAPLEVPPGGLVGRDALVDRRVP